MEIPYSCWRYKAQLKMKQIEKTETTEPSFVPPQAQKRPAFRARDAVTAPVKIEFCGRSHGERCIFSVRSSTTFPSYEPLP